MIKLPNGSNTLSKIDGATESGMPSGNGDVYRSTIESAIDGFPSADSTVDGRDQSPPSTTGSKANVYDTLALLGRVQF